MEKSSEKKMSKISEMISKPLNRTKGTQIVTFVAIDALFGIVDGAAIKRVHE